MPSASSSSLLLLMITALLVATAALATDSVYDLQRRYDTAGPWVSVLRFTVDTANLRVRPASSKAQQTLSPQEISALSKASMLYYRVVAKDQLKEQAAAAAVTTACSLIRAFEAAKAVLTLPEVVNVVLAVDGTVTGLQLSSKASGTCDMSVLSLFPSVVVSTTVGAYKAAEPKHAQNVIAEPAHFVHPSGIQMTAEMIGKKRSSSTGGKGESGSGSDDGPKEDNRTFFEKYQMYILMFVVYTVVNGFIGGKKGAEGAGARGGGGGGGCGK